ncbi:hypothetical protein NPIL_553651 [Nephila pilipes]|uniref:Uncharacterized protein n=1 Tax=Nephila pilipes TaxID=299642 RepID=A0A8X6TQD7_NEPPI|nr:hypothetical protein NPIL_526601 [Nephila pilipes]GFT95810.1 hypothetical protein NPIL_553651 [Nephila pilipes]
MWNLLSMGNIKKNRRFSSEEFRVWSEILMDGRKALNFIELESVIAKRNRNKALERFIILLQTTIHPDRISMDDYAFRHRATQIDDFLETGNI